MGLKMAVYSALELPYARPVAKAILESGDFRHWVIAGTKHENAYMEARPIGVAQASLRSPKMKNPYWFNYWCGKDSRCACRIETGIETDILLILECATGRRLGLHIEMKRPGEKLGDGQAESYPRRAACWSNPHTRPKTVPPHQDFLTMLVCGRELASDRRVGYFDKVVFHDDVCRANPGLSRSVAKSSGCFQRNAWRTMVACLEMTGESSKPNCKQMSL